MKLRLTSNEAQQNQITRLPKWMVSRLPAAAPQQTVQLQQNTALARRNMQRGLLCVQAGVQVLHTAAHVAPVHMVLAYALPCTLERLYLHGADKADQHIGQPVQIVVDKMTTNNSAISISKISWRQWESLHQVVAVAGMPSAK